MAAPKPQQAPCGPPQSNLASQDEILSRTASFVCQAHERAVARLRAEVDFRAEAEAAAARAAAAVATLEEEARAAAERVAALEAEAAAREAEVRGM